MVCCGSQKYDELYDVVKKIAVSQREITVSQLAMASDMAQMNKVFKMLLQVRGWAERGSNDP